MRRLVVSRVRAVHAALTNLKHFKETDMAENFVDNPSLLKDVLEKEVQRKTGIHWELYGAPVLHALTKT